MQIPIVLRMVLPVSALRSAADVDAEICEEFEFHLAMAEADNLRAGMSAEEARNHAESRFGDMETSRRACQRIDLGPQLWLGRLQLLLLGGLLGAVVYQGVLLVEMRSNSRQRIDELTRTIELLEAARVGVEQPSDEKTAVAAVSALPALPALPTDWDRGNTLAQPWSDWQTLEGNAAIP